MIEAVQNFIETHAPDALVADGFDEAVIGVVSVHGKTLVLYDREKCIEVLVRDASSVDGDKDDAFLLAEEYFTFNVEGAYVGENTPAFATLIKEESHDAHPAGQ